MKNKYENISDSQLYFNLAEKGKIVEESFAELYSRFSQSVYAYCRKVLSNHEDANDIFQESFTKFFNSAKSHTDTLMNVEGYLMTITRNLCINHNRDKKHHLNIDDFELFSDEKSYEDKELSELMKVILDTLDHETREVFVMRFYQGYTYPQIAKLTNINESTVKNKVWRAKERIKEALAPYLQEN